MNALPPNDREAERLTLREIFMAAGHPDGAGRKLALRARTILRPEDFYDTKHRRIFEAVCALVESLQEPEIVTVNHWLQDRGVTEVTPADLGRIIE